jgi:hypothetical protein
MIPKRPRPGLHRDGVPAFGRDALRAAIARRAEAAEAITRHRDAVERSRQLVTAAQRKADRAARAISGAKSEHVRLMADAIISGDDDVAGGGIVRAARVMQIQGTDDLEIAQAALRRLQAQEADVRNALALAEGNITVAINELLAPIARAALEQLRRLDEEVAPRPALLKLVMDIGTERGPRLRDDTVRKLRVEEAIRRPLEDVRRTVNDYFAARITGDVASAMRVWSQTREELRENLDAPLPGLK